MYIDDCLKGTQLIMASDYLAPSTLEVRNWSASTAWWTWPESIAGIKVKRNYKLDAPRGASGRNSDNELIAKIIGWAPSITLRDGLEKTYRWIHDRMANSPSHGLHRVTAAA